MSATWGLTTSHWIPDGSGPSLLADATVGGRLREVAAEVPLTSGFPMTGSGKIQKFAIREAWEKGHHDGGEVM